MERIKSEKGSEFRMQTFYQSRWHKFTSYATIGKMLTSGWPDALQPPESDRVAAVLMDFWRELAQLPEWIVGGEQLLCARCTGRLRHVVLEMMLALNGIAFPVSTRHLNRYLSDSQRAAIEKTLLIPAVDGDAWIGQAVALVVIYRWYAPQLVARFGLAYPQTAEDAALRRLVAELPDWPLAIQTD